MSAIAPIHFERISDYEQCDLCALSPLPTAIAFMGAEGVMALVACPTCFDALRVAFFHEPMTANLRDRLSK